MVGESIAAKLNLKFIATNYLKHHNFNELEINPITDTENETQCILIIGALPDSNHTVIEIMLHVNALVNQGAKQIILVLPYLPYGRQSRDNIVFQMLNTFNKVVQIIIAVDCHSKMRDDIATEITHYDVFGAKVLQLYKKDHVIIAPDRGSVRRLEQYVLNGFKTATMTKRRSEDYQTMSFSGDAKDFFRKDCIIIDDIVDSASTICGAASFLNQCGASSIKAFVSHNLLMDNKSIYKIETSYINELVVTNTLGLLNNSFKSDKIKIVDVSEVLAQQLQKIINRKNYDRVS